MPARRKQSVAARSRLDHCRSVDALVGYLYDLRAADPTNRRHHHEILRLCALISYELQIITKHATNK